MFVAFRFPFLGLFMLAMLPGFIVGTLISYFLTSNNRPCVVSTAPPTPALIRMRSCALIVVAFRDWRQSTPTALFCKRRRAAMKRLLFAGGVVLALAAPPAHAQAVVTCTNCSTIGQQLIDYGKQIQQLANEIQTATNTLNTYTTWSKIRSACQEVSTPTSRIR